MEDVNRIKFNVSFVEDGLSELPWIQTQRVNYYKLTELLVKRFNTAQNEVVRIAYLKFLDNAEGDLLDIIASHYFIERNSRNDDDLRTAIKLYAVRQTSEPTRDEIVKILNLLTDNGFVKIYKGVNGYVEVVVAIDCLSLGELKDELAGIFPLNANMKVCIISVQDKPFGLGSEFGGATDKIAPLGSVFDSPIERLNLIATTIIDDERY